MADEPCRTADLALAAAPAGTVRAARMPPLFGGLLSEESQRTVAAGALGVSPGNELALLDRLGGDVAGALSLLHAGEGPTSPAPPCVVEALDDGAFAAILDQLPRRPLLAGEGACGSA